MVISHRQAKGFIDCSCVTVSGDVVTKHGHRLKAGDTVKVSFDPEQTYDVMPAARKLQAGPFETLWEDTHLLFVFKPAGLLTVPTEKAGEASLAEAITESYRRRGFKRFNLFIVHRLDRFTSGVLVFAKTPEALHGLKKHFELHRLQRVYFAILVGELPENSGTLAGHLIEHAKSLKMSVATARKGPGGGKRMPAGAKEAVTHYRVIERLPGHTVVEVKLETGRRNQIRVQFADRGFPLLGDQVYGTESPLLDRQALHAELLGFKHPVTEEQVTVTAPMPADMEAALKALRNQARLYRAASGVKGEEGIFQPTESRDHKLKRVARAKRFDSREETSGRTPRPRRDEGEERPRRASGPTDRPARPHRADGELRPRSASGPNERSVRPRREDGDERPRRTFGSAERPARPRREDGAARPRPASAASDRPARPRPVEGDDRPRRAFGPADRPARPRREDGEARPRPASGSGDRPARPRRGDAEARPRAHSDSNDRPDRPRRPEGDERPHRTFGSAERPVRPRREDGEARPRSTAGPSDRPARPRRADSDERPRRTFGSAERPARTRREEGEARSRPAIAGPRSPHSHREGPLDQSKRKPAPRPGKPKPRKS
jgi:23S rRNA pseudouridine1911/1915/1917 synthase